MGKQTRKDELADLIADVKAHAATKAPQEIKEEKQEKIYSVGAGEVVYITEDHTPRTCRRCEKNFLASKKVYKFKICPACKGNGTGHVEEEPEEAVPDVSGILGAKTQEKLLSAVHYSGAHGLSGVLELTVFSGTVTNISPLKVAPSGGDVTS